MTIRVGCPIEEHEVREIVDWVVNACGFVSEQYGGQGPNQSPEQVDSLATHIVGLFFDRATNDWPTLTDKRWPKKDDPDIYSADALIIHALIAEVAANS